MTGPVLAALEIRDRGAGAGGGGGGGESSCIANDGFCPGWIRDNLDRYEVPFREHVVLVLTAVAIGFAISFTLALIAHRRRWLVAPVIATTSIMYTLPSVSLFFILQPITGLGFWTAEIALVSYTLLIIFRNVVAGLDNVPDEARDAARGMGLTDAGVLWRVELPLAIPEIMAGLRVATVTTVGLAALAFFAGAGGLGGPIKEQLQFQSNVAVAGGLCVLLAIVLDVALLLVGRAMTPWTRKASAA